VWNDTQAQLLPSMKTLVHNVLELRKREHSLQEREAELIQKLVSHCKQNK